MGINKFYMYGIIYSATNQISNKKYIGKTSNQ
jgi:hypothetical protein